MRAWEITDTIASIYETHLGLLYTPLFSATHERLGIDSSDYAEIVIEIEDILDVKLENRECKGVSNIGMLCALVLRKLDIPLPKILDIYAPTMWIVKGVEQYELTLSDTNYSMTTEESLSDSWQSYFFDMCDTVSKKSKDLSTKVGAVVVGPEKNVLGTAFNGLPMGVRDDPKRFPERYSKPDKYLYVSHAEANIIALAARHGVRLEGSMLFVNLHPCVECAKLIIQAGIKEVYCRSDEGTGNWREYLPTVRAMFNEADVILNVKE